MRQFLFLFLLLPGLTGWAQEQRATPPKLLTVPEGFVVELLRSAQPQEGSWISMTFDDKGRVIVALDRKGLARIEINKDGSTSYEMIEDSLKHCRGILFAHDALYANATNSNAFYRLRDTNEDDQFDDVKLLKTFDYRSRYGHGQNQIKLGPDGMLYIVIGNDCSFPEGTSLESPYRNPQNDQLLPNPHDAGHDNRVGYILRTDEDGKSWDVLAGGLRNQVDIAFNKDGEMFTWDADMEWDIGTPWYRPTRVNHIVSGGEYGWRWGSGKWPNWRADALPSNLDTGLGSPTGMEFGTNSQFPENYQKLLYMADWQNGRILVATTEPAGASYQMTYETFIEGSVLNVSDLVFGPDGALYFITGGRGSQSGLYRVRYTRKFAHPSSSPPKSKSAQSARKLRRKLETYHTRKGPEVVPLALKHLESEDPWIRFAARLALERQDVTLWRNQVLTKKPIHGLMALCRFGEPADLDPVLSSIASLPLEDLTDSDQLAAFRTLQLAFIRLASGPVRNKKLSSRLLNLYPSSSKPVNRELLELVVYLQSPQILKKALAQLETEPTQEEQIFIAQTLLHLNQNWDQPSKHQLLTWLLQAKQYRGGRLLQTAIKNLKTDYHKKFGEPQAPALQELTNKVLDDTPAPLIVSTPGSFVKVWKMNDFQNVEVDLKSRDLTKGRQAAAQTLCLVCHKIGDEGGMIGPDLTAVGARFDVKALLESILIPSKVIAPKYRAVTYKMSDGNSVTGIAAGVWGKKLRIEVNPLTQQYVDINRAEIVTTEPATISTMPPGLINTLTREQILDLLAYLQKGGHNN